MSTGKKKTKVTGKGLLKKYPRLLYFSILFFLGISGANNAKPANFFDDHNICKNSNQR